jgi:hypothetical protein
MRNRGFVVVFLSFCLLACAACGGQLYKVAPLPHGEAPGLSSSNPGGLNAGAFALEGDSALERFEANLPLAGVVALDLRLENTSAESLDLARFKFALEDAAGKRLKPLAPKRALGAVMKHYGNSFYTLAARQNTRDDYESVALKLGGLAPREERRGILFFQTDRNTTRLNGLTLRIQGPATPVRVSVIAR